MLGFNVEGSMNKAKIEIINDINNKNAQKTFVFRAFCHYFIFAYLLFSAGFSMLTNSTVKIKVE